MWPAGYIRVVSSGLSVFPVSAACGCSRMRGNAFFWSLGSSLAHTCMRSPCHARGRAGQLCVCKLNELCIHAHTSMLDIYGVQGGSDRCPARVLASGMQAGQRRGGLTAGCPGKAAEVVSASLPPGSRNDVDGVHVLRLWSGCPYVF